MSESKATAGQTGTAIASPGAVKAMSASSARPVNSAFAAAEPLAERLLHMLVATAAELAVARERLGTLERYLAQAGTLPEDGLDSAEPAAPPRAAAGQGPWRERFLDRLFLNLYSEIESARRDNENRPE